jgi:hypothetical protein
MALNWCWKNFAEIGIMCAIAHLLMDLVRWDGTSAFFSVVFGLLWSGIRYLVRNRPACGLCSGCSDQ